MKILHTADWHLGCSLGAEKRYEEHDALLAYLCSLIREQEIEAVIISGDVFDTSLPPNRAAEQYYRFLLEAGRAGAENIIVIGGNHDSASYLEAPKEVLKHLSVHVFASASEECGDMIVELKDREGRPAALVGAVPYLHERDLVSVAGGQGITERETALRNAVLDFYRRMSDALDARSRELPHIVTGHLFAVDSGISGDSWTGTLMSIAGSEFPAGIDYLALGHLHDARTVKTPHKTCIRYPGSPLNISFRELEVPKSVTVIDTQDVSCIREIPVPAFQDMRLLQGTVEEIRSALDQLISANKSVWCSVENTGSCEPGLSEILNSLVRDTPVKILSCRNQTTNPAVLERLPGERRLADLVPSEVFALILKEHGIAGEDADLLRGAFNEIETAAGEEEEKEEGVSR